MVMTQAAVEAAVVAYTLLIAYFIAYKSALSKLWYRPLSPVLNAVGFRHICMDMGFGLYAVRWRKEWIILYPEDE